MRHKTNTYGLVLCGGESSRMGSDKSAIVYHGKSQRHHVYEMLESICTKTFISCNSSQTDSLSPDRMALTDLPAYSGIGPMGALLTAFSHFPQINFLVVGCDYPLLGIQTLRDFFSSVSHDTTAFYNREHQLYEPTLAWYSGHTFAALMSRFKKREYSLQHYLQGVNAKKYYPSDTACMRSADTPQEADEIKFFLQKNVLIHG